MNVICGVNGEPWTAERPLYVCHHCGMPVCERDGIVVGADDDFDSSSTPVERAAMHCPSCVEEHHRRAAKRKGWADPKLQAGLAASPASAVAAPGRHQAYGQQLPYSQQARGRAAGGR